MIKDMVTRESQITTQIVLNNQSNSNTIENKKPVKFTKLQIPRDMNMLTKLQPNPTVDKTAATIQKISSSIETLRTLLQREMNFSLLK